MDRPNSPTQMQYESNDNNRGLFWSVAGIVFMVMVVGGVLVAMTLLDSPEVKKPNLVNEQGEKQDHEAPMNDQQQNVLDAVDVAVMDIAPPIEDKQQEIPGPPTGELELLESFDLAELNTSNRIELVPNSETDNVDENGSPLFGGEFVWTNTKRFHNPEDENDYTLTKSEISRYTSLKGPNIIDANGRVNRHVDVSTFKGGAKNVFVGSFLGKTSKIQFSRPFPLYSGKFEDGKRSGTWVLYHDQTEQIRVRGSYQNGRREGVFECYDPAGNRLWKGVYQANELHLATVEPLPKLPDNMKVVRGLINPVSKIVFSPDGTSFAVVCLPATVPGSVTRSNRKGQKEWLDSNTAVSIFDSSSGDKRFSIKWSIPELPQVYFSPDSQAVVVGSEYVIGSTSGTGTIWNVADGKLLQGWFPSLKADLGQFSEDGSRFTFSARSTFDPVIPRSEWGAATYVIETATGTLLKEFDPDEYKGQKGNRLPAWALSLDGSHIALGGSPPTGQQRGLTSVSIYVVETGEYLGDRIFNIPEAKSTSDEQPFLLFTKTVGGSKNVFKTRRSNSESMTPFYSSQLFEDQTHLTMKIDDEGLTVDDLQTGQQLYHFSEGDDVQEFSSRNCWIQTVKDKQGSRKYLHDLETGQTMCTLHGIHDQPSISPDRKWLAGNDSDSPGKTRLISINAPQPDQILPVNQVTAKEFSPNSDQLIMANSEGEIYLIQLNQKEGETDSQNSGGTPIKLKISEVSANPKAGLFAYAEVTAINSESELHYQYRLGADGKWIADADGKLRFRVPNLPSVKLDVRAFGKDSNYTPIESRELTISENPYADWELLYAFETRGSYYKGATIVGIDSSRLGTYSGEDSPYSNVKISPHLKTMIAFGSRKNGIIRTWKLNAPPATAVISCRPAANGVGDFSFNGDYFCSGTGTNLIQLWDMTKGKVSFTETNEADTGLVLNFIAMHPTADIVSCVVEGKTVRSWDLSNGKLINELSLTEGFDEKEVWMSWAADGSRFACSSDSLVRTYKPNGELLARIETNSTTRPIFVSAGSTICTLDRDDEMIKSWNSETGEQILELAIPDCISMNVDSTYDALSVGTYQGKIVLLVPESGEQLGGLNCYSDEVENLSFSKDGTLLVSTSDNGKICMWGSPHALSELKFMTTAED
ncbi:WD40 repeat domain-containing protein [Rubinisphaera sp.]|uniref:WD40 repeat domain-containing protein n=1 Tax=Rubinisphaera sp. TaxID=2024857 RepID=UPI0025ED3D54|nr:WD40 repeat domain-containing protein [Rubinisphaera sp.]